MSTAATALAQHDALLPRPPGGNAPGAALALLVHAGLLAALTVSVDWRSRTDDVVSAELWASVPQVAAPKAEAPVPMAAPAPAPAPVQAAPPPPTVRPAEPDIAVEREQRRKQQEQLARLQADAQRAANEKKALADKAAKAAKAEQLQREQAVKDAKDAKALDDRLKAQREAQLKRMLGQAGLAGDSNGRAGSTGNAANDAAPSAAYGGRIAALIRRASVFTGQVSGNPAAEVEVTAAPSGTIIGRRLVKSSGSNAWDDAVLQAIDKVGTLPRDTDGRVPPKFIIAFKPYE